MFAGSNHNGSGPMPDAVGVSIRRSIERVGRRAAVATGALLVSGAMSTQAEAARVIVPAGSGLTHVGGLAVAPDGGIWVSDGLRGVCRVRPATAGVAAGLIEDGTWCALEPRPAGPTAPFGMAFITIPADEASAAPTPAQTYLFVAEGSSAGAGVWRLAWDASTGTITGGERIVTMTGDNRVFGLTAAPGGAIDFAAKRDTLLRRIANPTSCVAPCGWTTIGSSIGGASLSLAYQGTALHIAELTGLSRVATPGVGDTAAQPATEFPSTAFTGLTSDPGTGRLYGATHRVTDEILVRDAEGTVNRYYAGFAGVTALAAGPDGTLYVADDPATGNGGVDVEGQSRLLAIPLRAVTVPAVSFATIPPVVSRQGDVVFTYGAGGKIASYECSLDGAVFSACGTGPDATSTFTVPEGPHGFAVRATVGNVVGEPSTWSFAVDRTAPQVTIDSTTRVIQGTSYPLEFSADELFVDFTCSVDGGEGQPCDSPRRLTDLSYGDHEVTVVGTDLAGNTGQGVPWTFKTVQPPPKPKDPDRMDRSGDNRSGHDAGRDEREHEEQKVVGSSIPMPCAGVAAPRKHPRFGFRTNRWVVVGTVVPRAARFAKLTLRYRGDLLKELAVRPVLGGRPASLRLRLTMADHRRLRTGNYELAVSFSTCRIAPGNARRAVAAKSARVKRSHR
ncbi:MAG: Ig-like domain repeat protein [Solirubrobacterales bacterium]|nr:Ig-like domain repeat protein [Solirubrobacterales bacterium]